MLWAIAASAGVVFAHYFAFIEPNSFGMLQSVLILAMVIAGGPAARLGPILGAVAFIVIPELLRFVSVGTSTVGHVRQILYGSILIVMMLVYAF